MRSRYSPAAVGGTGPAPASASAPARPSGAARHQLWHLSSPLLRALLLAAALLPLAARAQAPTITGFTPGSGPVGSGVSVTGTNLSGLTAVAVHGTAGTLTGVGTAQGFTFAPGAGSTSGALTLATAGGGATSAPNPVLRLQATGGTSSDNTAFIDQVEIIDANGAVVSGGVANGSFESGAPATETYGPTTVTSWFFSPITFEGNTAITTTASAFGPPAPPDGSAHLALLQLKNGYVEQTLALGAGTYRVRFMMAQRQCCAQPYDQAMRVLINGVAVGAALTTSSASYVQVTSLPFTISTAGTFTVTQPSNVVSTAPTRNTTTAGRATNVALTYDQAANAALAASVRVYSQQAGGRKAATATASGNTVTLDPSTDFKPGETVYVTSPAGAAKPYVYQFTAQAGTGPGTFGPGSETTVYSGPNSVAVGDVDGDGDLDLLTTSANFTNDMVSVRLNGGNNLGTNTGVFSAGAEVTVGSAPRNVVLGDVDGDGDLDLLTANSSSSTVSVRLNGGNNLGTNTGVFSAGTDLAVGSTYGVAVGDVDGDGDLDLVATSAGNNMVSVRLNGGNNLGTNTGVFSAGAEVTVGFAPQSVALGDVDGDGDLDLLTANSSSSTVSVRLNGGNNLGTNTGVFSAGTDLAVGGIPKSVALGDVDGDGDLDLLAGNSSSGNGTVSVRLNGGNNLGTNTGVFSAGTDVAVAIGPQSVAVGDVDGDGDLDLLAGSSNANGTVSVRLNRLLATITGFTPSGGGVGTSVTLTGNNLSGATSVTFNGVVQTIITNNTDTSLTVDVPAGATTGPLTVTTAGGIGLASTAVFILPPAIMSIPPLATVGSSISLTGINLSGATAITFSGANGNVVTSGFTAVSSTSITGIVVPAGATTGPLTVTTAVAGTSAASTQVLTIVTCPTGGRLYVRAANATPGDGSSWATAYASLGEALYVASQCNAVSEIWAAEGTYVPTRDPSGNYGATAARNKTFYLPRNGFKLYGGFAGTENSLTDRTPGHPTVLSGDLDGNDTAAPTATTMSGNAYHVLLTVNATAATVLDGLRVQGGNANGSTLVVGARTVTGNIGGGLNNTFSSPTVSNCVFSGNRASGGAGTGNATAAPIFTNCVWSGNAATSTGGGVYNTTSPAVLTNCVLTGNTAASAGGAMYSIGSSPTLTSCTVSGNTATTQGGGLYYFTSAGGTVQQCILWSNTGGTTNRQEIFKSAAATALTVRYSIVRDGSVSTANFVTNGGNNRTADPLYVNAANPAGADNLFGTADDGLALQAGSPAINAGDPALTSPSTDITGAPRIGVFDLGAYELPVPTIAATGLSATSGLAGSSINLTGTNLTGATAITFSGTSGNVVTSGFTVVSSTSITGIVVPAGATTGPLTVTTAGGTSAPSAQAFTVLAAPVLAATPGATLAPEQVPTAVDAGLTVTDADSPTLASATVSISSGLVPAEDALAFVPAGNITGAYDAATGVLSLASAAPSATLADWQAVLQSITYVNSSDTPTTADRTVSFVVSDGGLDSNLATRLVQVQAVNDAPAAPTDADPAPNAVAENAAPGTLVGLTVAATDVDNATLTYSLTDDAGGRFVIEPATGVVRVAPGAGLDFEAAGSYPVTAQATDGSLTSSLAFVIGLTDVNEAPVVADQSYTTQEDGAAGTVVGTVLATDPDAGQALTYTLTAGNTGGAFALVGNQLQVANAAALDLAATPTFTLTVDVADNGTPALSSTATLTVTLTPAPCAEPQGVAVGSIGTSTANLSFAGSATATSGYLVTYAAAGGPAQTTLTTPASPVMLMGLQPNTTYSLTVTSLCSRTQSAVSATTTFTTLCEAPTLAAIASQTTNVDAGTCGASVSFAASASGTPAPALSFTLGGAPIGSPYVFPVGTSTVTATASSCGGTATRTFTVTVLDNVNPTITTPVSVVVSNDAGQCAATNVALGTPTAGDNCTGVRVRNNAPASFPKGTTTVTWTATDASGNTATATQMVTVRDTEAPMISAPAAITASTDAGQCSASTVYLSNPVLGDNCPGVTVRHNAPATFPKGVTTVTWTATDAAGNVATATQLVTVTDNERPTITAPAAKAVATTAGQCSATNVALGTATAGDNCTGVTVTSNAPATFPKGTTTVTWMATDAAGNTSTATQLVTVTDTEKPVLALPANLTVSAPANQCSAVVSFMPTATDNCTGATLTASPASGSTFAVGTSTVTVTATDASGNVSTGSFTVTVTGSTPPAPTIAVAPAALNNGKMYLLYLGYGSQTATLTASGGTSYSWSPAAGLSNPNSANPVFTPTAEGTYTFTVTATGAGCSAGASTTKVTIVVEDVRCGTNNEKTQVCHNGQTICVASNALSAHLGHGDKLGNCAAPRPAAPAEVAAASAAPALAVFPNPAADHATVSFHAPADGNATVLVYNELGQVVARLFDGAVTGGQDYALALNSQPLAAGLYVCRLVLNGHTELRRLTVVR